MTQAERNKAVTVDFAIELHGMLAEFASFASTGMASKISNLVSVYMMYLKSLDYNKDLKS
jgi:hypothetical protein